MRRQVQSVVLAATALAGVVLVAAPASAALPTGCVQATPTDVTCTYTTAGESTFTVPDGLTQISVTATGSFGGSSNTHGGGGPGGVGAIVTGAVSVTPGAPLYVEVGAVGTNGGGSGSGANGGGASDVRTTAAGQDGSLASRLLVAGGGGGGGGITNNGSAGGAAGQDGTDGGGIPGSGGKAGTQSAGGAAGVGSNAASSGSLGQGGASAFCAGGGGGGLYGGGGGESLSGTCGAQGIGTGAGGGGGGSSLVPAGGTSTLAADITVPASVVLTYADHVVTTVSATSAAVSYPVAPSFTVSGLPASASGSVTFTDDATSTLLCAADAPSGSCDSADVLGAGSHTIDVGYVGDDVHLGSSTQITATVNQGTPTVAIQGSTNPSTYGESPTATATITPDDVAGTVQFSVDGNDLNTPVTVSGGTATSPELVGSGGDLLTGGDHTVSAVLTPTDATDWTTGSNDYTQTVDAADSNTTVAISPTHLTATVAPTASYSVLPTGTVDFSVAGTPVGSATLSNGIAVLTYTVPTSQTGEVAAAYVGDQNFLASSGSTARSNPTLTATITSSKHRNAAGWYRTPVTVRFTCKPGSAALTATCPASVTLTKNTKSTTVARTVHASDGGIATTSAGPIRLDTTAPSLHLTHLKPHSNGTVTPKCVAHDATSGLKSCKVTVGKLVHGKVKVSATATDIAGNVSHAHGTVAIADFLIKGVPIKDGRYVVHRGHSYLAEVRSKSRPTYLYATPARSGRPTPTVRGPRMDKVSPGVWTIPIGITNQMKHYRLWNVGARFGGKLHIITLDVRK